MLRFLRTRTLQSLLTLVSVVVIVFFLVRLTGNPATVILPENAPQALRDEFMRSQGLDQPVYMQFLIYVQNLAQLNFGESFRRGEPAIDLVMRAFPYTLQLAFVSITLSLIVAVIVGSLSAWRPNSIFDRIANILSITSASVPDFWLAIVGILIFAVTFRWLPSSGIGTGWHWVLPIATLMLRPTGILTQVVRGAMIAALSSPYAKTARGKGIPETYIIFQHGLKNAALPIITVTGDQLAGLVNGAVVVETVFGWPGIGKLMIDSILQRDFLVLQACVLVTAAAIFILNIVIDTLYAALDPRIRRRYSGK